jgi:FkbM family methyltransferase
VPQIICLDFNSPKFPPFKISLDLSLPVHSFLHSYLSRGDLYDEPLVRALTDPLKPGDTFLDIGSHIGYLSILALQRVLPTGQVWAFEPHPQSFAHLKTNAELNSPTNFHVMNVALGDQPGTANLHINPHEEGLSTLLPTEGRPVSVQVLTLDQLHAQHNFQNVAMVKIDVEGFEERVIRGGEKFFSAKLAQNVVFEINTDIPGVPPRADYPIRKFFSDLGYQAYLIHPPASTDWVPKVFGNKQYVRLPIEKKMDISFGNILLTPRPIDAAEV